MILATLCHHEFYLEVDMKGMLKGPAFDLPIAKVTAHQVSAAMQNIDGCVGMSEHVLPGV